MRQLSQTRIKHSFNATILISDLKTKHFSRIVFLVFFDMVSARVLIETSQIISYTPSGYVFFNGSLKCDLFLVLIS